MTYIITLGISKCYGKVRMLFFRATTLVSADTSHNSAGVCGLVVRCLLFNPEASCSNHCVFVNFFTSRADSKQPISIFFGLALPLDFIGFVRLFLEFFCPHLHFLIFCNTLDVKNVQSPPFTIFDI